ncbi:MAG: FhaA domain-containing protein, partial [Actinomycetota bacterium]
HFEFGLAADDAERLEQAGAALAAELKTVALENAAERGWGLVGPPEIVFTAREGLGTGDFTCAATLVEGALKIEPAAAPGGRPTIVVHEDGAGARTIPLVAEVISIGRLAACDIVLKDKGASRRHAQIRTKDGVVTLTDLGSTNGTRLNGQTVQTRILEDGDRITIGTTTLEFRRA